VNENPVTPNHQTPDRQAPDDVPEQALVDHVDEAAVAIEIDRESQLRPAPTVEEFADELGIDIPEDYEEAKAVLLLAVAGARQEAGDYLETLQRVAAEYENYRKRVERDESDTIMRSSRRILEQLLPSLDAFDAALAYQPNAPGEEAVLEGMRGTHNVLMETLSREGFEPIEAAGKPFDPAYHEAVSGPTAEGNGDLVVAQELRKGYTLRGLVVRPTLVMVEHG